MSQINRSPEVSQPKLSQPHWCECGEFLKTTTHRCTYRSLILKSVRNRCYKDFEVLQSEVRCRNKLRESQPRPEIMGHVSGIECHFCGERKECLRVKSLNWYIYICNACAKGVFNAFVPKANFAEIESRVYAQVIDIFDKLDK